MTQPLKGWLESGKQGFLTDGGGRSRPGCWEAGQAHFTGPGEGLLTSEALSRNQGTAFVSAHSGIGCTPSILDHQM